MGHEEINTFSCCLWIGGPLFCPLSIGVYSGLERSSAPLKHQSFSVNFPSAYQSSETRVNIVFDSICLWQRKAKRKLPPLHKYKQLDLGLRGITLLRTGDVLRLGDVRIFHSSAGCFHVLFNGSSLYPNRSHNYG